MFATCGGDFGKGSFTSASDFAIELSTNQCIPEIVAAATSGRLSKIGVGKLVRAMQPLLDLFYQPGEMQLLHHGQKTAETLTSFCRGIARVLSNILLIRM